MSEKTLLEKALQHHGNPRLKEFTSQEMDLAEAWMEDKVTLTQLAKALDTPTSSQQRYVWVARCARAIWQTRVKGRQ